MDFVRHGHCRRCGSCCKALPIWENLTDEDRALLRINDREAELILQYVKNFKCPKLIENNGTATCSIHEDSNRPRFCKLYPADPDDLLEGCGYWFEIKHPTVIYE